LPTAICRGRAQPAANPTSTQKASSPPEPLPPPDVSELGDPAGTNALIDSSLFESARPFTDYDAREFEVFRPADSTNFVTPQMLLHFFEQRTERPKGTSSGVIGVLPFTPPVAPVAPPRRDSKATAVTP